jgi:hypothetical protein
MIGAFREAYTKYHFTQTAAVANVRPTNNAVLLRKRE